MKNDGNSDAMSALDELQLTADNRRFQSALETIAAKSREMATVAERYSGVFNALAQCAEEALEA